MDPVLITLESTVSYHIPSGSRWNLSLMEATIAAGTTPSPIRHGRSQGTKQFEDRLFSEIRDESRRMDDTSAPERKWSSYYYERTLEGKEYVQHCRRPLHMASCYI